jgi:hypothetical protein
VLAVVVGVFVVLAVIGSLVGTTADDEDAVPVDVEAAAGEVLSTSEFSVTLPEGWVGAEISESGEGFGASLFPSEPELAAAMDGLVANVPRSIRMLAFDESGIRAQALFVDNMNVLRDDSIPDDVPFDEMVRVQENSFGAMGFEVLESERVELDGRRFARIHAEVGTTYESLVYITEDAGAVWVLTYSFAEVGSSDRELADGSASTIAFE